MEHLTVKSDVDLMTFAANQLLLRVGQIKRLLDNGDIKVNGIRVKVNINLQNGDTVDVFVPTKFKRVDVNIDVVYKNCDIVIVNKPVDIDSVGEFGLEELLSKQLKTKVYPVHRLDRNTSGLIIFAFNVDSQELLEKALKAHQITKFYKAIVIGRPSKHSDTLKAFLFKDAVKSLALISSVAKIGYVPIETSYTTIEEINEELTLLSVKLISGKTHQIRAHLNYIGYPILGDGKYGDNKTNKKYNVKYQLLGCNRLKFNLSSDNALCYLNDMNFEISLFDSQLQNLKNGAK